MQAVQAESFDLSKALAWLACLLEYTTIDAMRLLHVFFCLETLLHGKELILGEWCRWEKQCSIPLVHEEHTQVLLIYVRIAV